MNETTSADRIVVFDKGCIVLTGTPKEVFSDTDMVKSFGLDVPQVTELFHELNKEGYDLPDGVLDTDTAFEILKKRLKS